MGMQAVSLRPLLAWWQLKELKDIGVRHLLVFPHVHTPFTLLFQRHTSLLGLPGLGSVHRGKVGLSSTGGFVAFTLSCPVGTEQTLFKSNMGKAESSRAPKAWRAK